MTLDTCKKRYALELARGNTALAEDWKSKVEAYGETVVPKLTKPVELKKRKD